MSIPPVKTNAVGWPSTLVIQWDRDQLKANGLDPAQVPDEPYHLKRVPAIKERYGWSTATLYRRIADGFFPKPIAIGPPVSAPPKNQSVNNVVVYDVDFKTPPTLEECLVFIERQHRTIQELRNEIRSLRHDLKRQA